MELKSPVPPAYRFKRKVKVTNSHVQFMAHRVDDGKIQLLGDFLKSAKQNHAGAARAALRNLIVHDALEARLSKAAIAELELIADRLIVTVNEPNPRFLSTGQAAKKLGVTDQTIINWITAGKIKAEKLPSGHYRVYADQFRTTDEEDKAFDDFFRRMDEKYKHLPPIDEDDLTDL